LGVMRNSSRVVKQKSAVGGWWETQLMITFQLSYQLWVTKCH